MAIQFPDFSHAPIDIHSHFDHGAPAEPPQKPIHIMDLEHIKAGYDRFGIYYAGMSTYASVMFCPECIVEENEYLHDFMQKIDWMYQWVVLDPRQEETYRQAERMLQNPKVLGIKIHPKYHDFDMLEHGDALFSFAEKHSAVVLMHPQHILEMPGLADKYPGMKLIIAHLSSMEHIEAAATAKHGNIYVDTSGSGVTLNNIIEYAVQQLGSEKLLFGTDSYSCAYSFGRIALADLPLEDKENILYKNALKMFPKAFR